MGQIEDSTPMLGKDLKPGMIADKRLVLGIDLEGSEKFWDGKPNWHFIDLNDPYFGPCTAELMPDDEYEISIQQGTPQYRKALHDIIGSMNEYIEHRTNDIKDVLNLLQ